MQLYTDRGRGDRDVQSREVRRRVQKKCIQQHHQPAQRTPLSLFFAFASAIYELERLHVHVWVVVCTRHVSCLHRSFEGHCQQSTRPTAADGEQGQIFLATDIQDL